jgi:hypothetical protein
MNYDINFFTDSVSELYGQGCMFITYKNIYHTATCITLF